MAQPIQADRIARYVEKISAEAETMDELCQRVAEGESLQEVCSAWDVPRARIAAWLAASPVRAESYAAALRLHADAKVAECIPISDEGNAEDQAHRKLRIDTRMRVAAKLDRVRFGDTLTHAGSKDSPITIETIERVIVDPKAVP